MTTFHVRTLQAATEGNSNHLAANNNTHQILTPIHLLSALFKRNQERISAIEET